MIHVYESVTRDKEKCALSALTDACIRHFDFSEKKMKFSLGQTKLSVMYVIYWAGVSRVGSTVPETWKRYHLRAETPCIGHYRKYLLRGVTSRYLQSGNQLEPISTDSSCIGWVSPLYMNMFKVFELWCPWIAPVKIHAPIWYFPLQEPCFIHYSGFRFGL